MLTRPLTRDVSGKDLVLAHPLFDRVSRDAVLPLLGRALVRKIPRGRVLHSPGEQSQPMYLLLSGRLRAYQLAPDGRRLVLEIIMPGGFDGVLPMLGKRGHFNEATADSVVACLEWKLLEELFVAEPHLLRNLVDMVATRLEGREGHLESMAMRDPTRRLARQLAALAGSVGEQAGEHRIALPRTITHQLLADMIGIRRETVTLHLRDLIELGAVDARSRPLSVDPSKLEAIAAMGDR